MCDSFQMDLNTVDGDARRFIQSISGIQGKLPFKTGEIHPTDHVPVLALGEHGIEAWVMIWGFPKWDGDGVVFNVKAETTLENP